jgi:hypothetical protein
MAIAVTAVILGATDLLRRLGELGEDAPRAAARALNRTMAMIKTGVVRGLAADTGLAQKDVRPSLDIKRATFRHLMAELVVTGARIPLLAFKARGREPSAGQGSGVTYALPGGRGRAEHAFIATMPTGHRGVYAVFDEPVRRSAGAWSPNLPIAELFGPSLPHAFLRANIGEAETARAGELLPQNLRHEIEFMLSQRTPSDDLGAEAVA